MSRNINAGRRKFLQTSAMAGTAFVASTSIPLAQGIQNAAITQGDINILRLFAALEIIETDLWQQYNELGGIQDKEVPGGSGNPAYTQALNNLDEDMSQYVHDNTDDEISHFTFLNAYLVSKGAQPVDLEPFRTLRGSQATGADKSKKRLTNLLELTVDTSWWTRYRDDAHNPDLDGFSVFPQAVPDLANGKFRAIPKNDADTTNQTHLQAIANTAAFHFRFHRAGRHQPLPHDGPESLQSGGLANSAQHRPERDHALPDLAGQGRQCASVDRSYQRPHLSRSYPTVRRAAFPEQPDHAGAMPLHRPEAAAMFGHSPGLHLAGSLRGRGGG